jgi:hypothetical protein
MGVGSLTGAVVPGFVLQPSAFRHADGPNAGVQFSWQNSPVWLQVRNGDDTEYEYPLGPYLDMFVAPGDRPGLLLLHSPGNLFVRDLAPGQTVLVQPGSLVYTDTSVNYRLHAEYPGTSGLSWRSYEYRTIWLRLTGPGRIAVRSIFERPEKYAGIVGSSPMTYQRW